MKYYTTDKEAFLEQIKYSFELFKEKNGRYPLSYEVKVGGPYSFPSTKTIDRHFGGMKALRKLLGLETIDYTSGHNRSKQLKQSILPRFIESEAVFYNDLLKFFEGENIHKQETYKANSNTRSDFIVNTEQGKLGIDIFHANNYFSLSGCINSKLKKLKSITDTDIYLVSVADTITSEDIQNYTERKKEPINSNIKLFTKKDFLKYLQDNMNKI